MTVDEVSGRLINCTKLSMPALLLGEVLEATTIAPRRASSRAHYQPMPREAPVTMTVLPARL